MAAKAEHVTTLYGRVEYLLYDGRIIRGLADADKDPDGCPIGALPYDLNHSPINGWPVDKDTEPTPYGQFVYAINTGLAAADKTADVVDRWECISEEDRHKFTRPVGLEQFLAFKRVLKLACHLLWRHRSVKFTPSLEGDKIRISAARDAMRQFSDAYGPACAIGRKLPAGFSEYAWEFPLSSTPAAIEALASSMHVAIAYAT